MSLPWFAFKIDKFLSDTLALDGPAGGAYLWLMLHYYATEKPPRDNDRVLATIARLPLDVWIERRPELEEFFQIRDGAWHHATIEAEIAEAKLKHSSTIARASAGGLARWGKGAPKAASSKAKALPQASAELAATMKTARRNAQALPEAQPEQSPGNAHIHKQESLSVSVLTVEKDNSGDNSPEPSPEAEGLGTPIDVKFWPCANHLAMCKIDGADDETINTEVQKFVLHHLDKGSWSHDWDASFATWWHRWKEHQAKQKPKAPPRIEVNAQGYAPTDAEWRSFLLRWKSDSFWPRAAGPDPSTGRCKAPAELFEQLGIDPKTGLAVAKPKEPAT